MQIAHNISHGCKGQSPEETLWRLSRNNQIFTWTGNPSRFCDRNSLDPPL